MLFANLCFFLNTNRVFHLCSIYRWLPFPQYTSWKVRSNADGITIVADYAKILQEKYPLIRFHPVSALVDFGLFLGNVDTSKYESIKHPYTDSRGLLMPAKYHNRPRQRRTDRHRGLPSDVRSLWNDVSGRTERM